MNWRRFLSCQRGVASAEMALITPMALLLLFVGMEAGHFVWTQHKLAEAVRDGARFASRFRVDDLCNGAAPKTGTTKFDNAIADTKRVTRTGQLASSSAPSKVPGWTDSEITVTVTCQGYVDTGIYNDLGEAGPMVTVTAIGVNYPSLLEQLGLLDSRIKLVAKSNAAVIGL